MDRPEFETLAVGQLDAVYRMALHLTRNAEQADDVVQEVYARAFRPRSIETFEVRTEDAEASMRSWLFTITHNVFYTRAKKQSRQPQAVGEFFAEAADGPLPEDAPPAWSQADLNWEHVDGTLKKAIADLKPEFREVLMLWGVDGLKYREIGEILGVPIGTVMSRLHRARKILSDLLLGDEKAVRNLGLDRRERDESAAGGG